MPASPKKTTIWVLFAALCLIWGSSFILMKLAMYDSHDQPLLSAWQVGALRLFFSGAVLLPFALRAFRAMRGMRGKGLTGYVLASGFLGSFFPAFLFCLAETRIDSALAGTLNALTPLFTLLIAALVFRTVIPVSGWVGISVGLVGCLFLFISAGSPKAGDWIFSGFVVLATLFYALNVNMVKQRLQGLGSLDIAAVAMTGLIIPSLGVLWVSGYFSLPLHQTPLLLATGAAALLGMVGTAFASVIFYLLVKKAGIIFASLVTYGIPFVALGWGIWYGETINPGQVLALLMILAGVYLANAQWPAWLTRSPAPKAFREDNK